MSYPRIGDESSLHAGELRRLDELERKLPEDSSTPAIPGCCDTWCKYTTGATDMAVGALTTILSVTVPRPRAGRIFAHGWASAILLDGDGDFHWTLRLSYGGTLYDPRGRARNITGHQSDSYPNSVGSAFDYHAGADLAVGLVVHNLSAQAIRVEFGSLVVEQRGRGGSPACAPIQSGTGS